MSKCVFNYTTGLFTVHRDDFVIMSFPAFSYVRNELNGERSGNDVEYSINMDGSKGKPIMPRPFPKGTWVISSFEKNDGQWTKPFFGRTDARQNLAVWDLSEDGKYKSPSIQTVMDWGYGIHYCNGSHHTDGCIGIQYLPDMEWIEQNVPPLTILEVTD